MISASAATMLHIALKLGAKLLCKTENFRGLQSLCNMEKIHIDNHEYKNGVGVMSTPSNMM